jgi:hypothetical protein
MGIIVDNGAQTIMKGIIAMTDRKTKVLLGVIAAALWVIALHPLFPTRDVSAQTPGSPAPAPGKISYQLVDMPETFKAESKINSLTAQGWRAKSVAISDSHTVVLMERTGQ